MKHQDYVKARELRDPEFARLREMNASTHSFQIALVEARLNAGMTQKELAGKLQTSQSVVARWENGNSSPTLSTLRRLSAVLGADFTIRSSGDVTVSAS